MWPQIVMDPTQYDAINVLGEGLYHFRVESAEETSYCSLSTEFILYAYGPPLDKRTEYLTFATSAIFIAMGLFISYSVHIGHRAITN